VQIPVATREYSDYTLSPDLTETAVQDAIPTEGYGNFGLNAVGSAAEMLRFGKIRGVYTDEDNVLLVASGQ
jgi:hypothetical protein